MAEVWDNADVSSGELLFLLALADRAADDHRCAWPGVRVLQERARASRATVYRYAETAQERRIIERCPDDEIPEQYSRRGGRETVVWRFLPVEEWQRSATDPLQEGSQIETGLTSETPGVSSVRPEPTTTTTTGEELPATQESPSLRRARRERTKPGRRRLRQAEPDDMSDAVDAIWHTDDEDDDREPPRSVRRPRNQSADSAWGLNKYLRDGLFLATGRVGDHNDYAMMGFFSKAKKAGLTPETLREMVDVFVSDPNLINASRARWTTFIGSARLLQERAERARGHTSGDTKPTLGGAIPQHILDEILAESDSAVG